VNPSETEIGGSERSFPVTSWALLEQARAKRDAGGEGVRRLIELYWKPVYCFIRRSWSRSNEDAKDLTQEFFTRMVLDGTLLDQYSPSRGGFRPFLKASVTNFLLQARRDGAALKRGGGVMLMSLSGAEQEYADLLPSDAALTPEQAFDRSWERGVLARALERLERRLKAEAKAAAWEVFRLAEMTPRGETPSYKAMAEALGISVDAVKNHLTAARKLFLQAAKEEAAEHADGPEDLARELDRLFGN
jgi:RNA polymerase sigma factor (sigma-70 family)